MRDSFTGESGKRSGREGRVSVKLKVDEKEERGV